jgi:phosphatidylglycerol---prolipoprotein diacylglyceryl transferase
MIDLHSVWDIHNDSWWILPFFQLWSIKIPTYSFFVFLWLIVWISIVFYLSRKDKKNDENMFYVVFAWIIGWTIWAKLPIWIAYFSTILNSWNIEAFFSGRTITGWLIWWTLAVLLTKKKLWIKTRFWNNLVPGIIVWIALWRIWCFLAWCCYWEVTTLPWWVNFWDDLFRHPTQIYEILYLSMLLVWYLFLKNKKTRPWFLFDLFLLFYFGYRFLIEFIRVEPVVLYGFTWYQIASLVVVLYVLIKINYFRMKNNISIKKTF